MKRPVLICLGLLLVAALWPVSQSVAPEWDIYTLDCDGKPLAGITVREVWQQYGVEGSSHEEDRKSDTNGHVHFNGREVRSSILHRGLGCLGQVATTGVHASCGKSAYLVAFGDGVDTHGLGRPIAVGGRGRTLTRNQFLLYVAANAESPSRGQKFSKNYQTASGLTGAYGLSGTIAERDDESRRAVCSRSRLFPQTGDGQTQDARHGEQREQLAARTIRPDDTFGRL